MTQADPSDDASRADEDGALARLEHKLCLLEREVQELLAEEAFPPLPPAGRSRRRLGHRVRLYVITGGLAVLGLASVLPAENPLRVAVDYTISALVQQMPQTIPDPPDLGPIGIGNPDNQHQPLHPVAAIQSVLPSASPPAAAQASPTPQPTSLPIVAPVLVDQDNHHAAPTSPLTSAPSTPPPSAPPSQGPASTSAGAGPVSNDKRSRRRTSVSPSPTP